MRKLGIFIGITSLMMTTACNNAKNEPETQTDAPEVTRTTTTTTTRTNDNGTTIEIDEKDVSYGNKDGLNVTKVKVTTDSTKFKIKR